MQVKRKKSKARSVIATIIFAVIVAATLSAIISVHSAIKAKDDDGIVSYTSMVDDGVRVPVRIFGIIVGYVKIG